ncbi:MAG: type II toxin-antitoxin system VapC family toxin [Terracidiphilus sp.]
MIGLDTNILVRFFGQDDPVQGERAEEIMLSLTAEEPGWVALAALMELLWVMTSVFRFDRNGVIYVLDGLLSREQIVVEQADTVRDALRLYHSGNTDFPDCLIASSAKAAGCSRTVTFDRIAARDAGMQLIE